MNIEEKEMGFLDHLEALRWHVVRSLIAISVFSAIAFANKKIVFHDLILGPSRPDFITYKWLCALALKTDQPYLCIDKLSFSIQSRTMTGQFVTHLTVSLIFGFLVAFPYVFWEIWRFVRPALHKGERNATAGAVFFVSLLFGIGLLFGYYVLSPLSINFLANYQIDESVLNQFDLLSYISTLSMMVVCSALLFELPAVVYVASKAGLLTPALMRKFRKHSFVVILIAAAILTPSPDIFSQIIVAAPIYFLYEISIFISAFVEKQNKKLLNS